MTEDVTAAERKPKLVIRPYRPEDLEALVEVAVRTGNAGANATGMHGNDELLGYVFMAPYATYAPDLAWVAEKDGQPVGYLVAVLDSAQFDQWWQHNWAPVMDHKFPAEERAKWPAKGRELFEGVQSGYGPSVGELRPAATDPSAGASPATAGALPATAGISASNLSAATAASTVAASDEDQSSAARPATARPATATVSGVVYPSEMHINLLPAAQGLGAGRALIETLLDALRKKGAAGVTLGVGTGNENAVGFYKHLGFEPVLGFVDSKGKPAVGVMSKQL